MHQPKSLPLVMLPGTLCDGRLWQAHADVLGRQRQVILPTIGAAATLRGEAIRLLSILPPRFALAGFSLGAMVAFEMVRQARERIAGLCVVSSTARPDLPDKAAVRQAQLRRLCAGDVAGLVRQELLPGYFHSGAAATATDLARWHALVLAMAQDTPAAVFANQVRYAISRPDSLPLLQAMRVPVQIQCGLEDRLCPPSRQAEMAIVRSGNTLIRFPGCAHFLPLEAERSSIMSMQQWLDDMGNGIADRAQ